MMRAIRIVAGLVFSFCALAHAATDPNCLKHLGGAFGDVECFNGLSNDLKQQNVRLARSIAATIPSGNRNEKLLDDYLRNQIRSLAFCELSRGSLTEWVPEAPSTNPRYHDYDVAYYECVYNIVEQENKFLKSLLKNANQQ